MENYMKFEKAVINNYKRGLNSFDEAISQVSGYLKCMVDVGIIESYRAMEELNFVTKKLLDSEK